MKLSIFYFSGTGNTKYVSNHLAGLLKEKSFESESVSITDISLSERDALIESSDVLFFAYPTYGSDIPENMKRFIEKLPKGNGKKIGVICTQLFFSGDGASIYSREFKSKGYEQKWGYQVNMPNNLCIPGSPFFQSPDYEIHENKQLVKARTKIEKMCDDIVQDKKRLTDNTFFHTFLAMSQRPLFRWFVMESYKNALDINQEKCVSCGMCVASCPQDVIEIHDGIVSYENRADCVACLRCLNFCPSDAILFNGKNRFPHYKGPTKEIYRSLFTK